LLCAVLLASSAAVYAEPPVGAELSDQVVAVAEIGSVAALEDKLADLMFRLMPEAPPPEIGADVAESVLKTTDPTAVDLAAPLQVVLLGSGHLRNPVLIFSVPDGELYVSSLLPGIEEQGVEGDVRLFVESEFAEFDYEEEGDWEEPVGTPLAIGIVDGRVALGRDAAAVASAIALLQSGGLPAGTLFPGSEAGGMVRARTALEALAAEGLDPFEGLRESLRQAMSMAPRGQMAVDVLMAEIDALESVAQQVERLAGGVSFDQEEIRAWSRCTPVGESGLARYIQSTPKGELPLLDYMPSDAMAALAMKHGDISPLVEWGTSILEALTSASSGEDASVGRLAAAGRRMAAILGGEAAFAVSRTEAGTMILTEAAAVKDAAEAEAALQESMEAYGAMQQLQQLGGINMELSVHPDTAVHMGHGITEWVFDYEFTAPAGVPSGQQIAAMQEAVVQAIWGEDIRAYHVVVGDVLLYAQGSGGLEALKGMMEGPDASAAHLANLASALAQRPEEPTAVGYVHVEQLLSFYLRVLSQAMAQAGVFFPLPLANLHFEGGPPATVVAWIEADGSCEKQFRLPVQALEHIAGGFRRAFMPPPPQPTP
jgi:hypothetical protein